MHDGCTIHHKESSRFSLSLSLSCRSSFLLSRFTRSLRRKVGARVSCWAKDPRQTREMSRGAIAACIPDHASEAAGKQLIRADERRRRQQQQRQSLVSPIHSLTPWLPGYQAITPIVAPIIQIHRLDSHFIPWCNVSFLPPFSLSRPPFTVCVRLLLIILLSLDEMPVLVVCNIYQAHELNAHRGIRGSGCSTGAAELTCVREGKRGRDSVRRERTRCV